MTSNVGASEIAKNTGIGFTIGDETGITYEDMKVRIMGELKKVFRPEFLNRIDEVIVFHKLTKEEITEIVELLLKRIRESLAERELSLNLSDDASAFLVEKGWDPAMGARPLRRAIQRYIEDPLADEVLSQSMPPGSTIEVDKGPEGDGEDEPELNISIVKGKERTREAVGVGAKGGALEEGSPEEPEQPSGDGAPDLPDEPEVLPDVPDAPPAEQE
jgi:ATP-dependent Clp protease ATP-binding subunit ClpC